MSEITMVTAKAELEQLIRKVTGERTMVTIQGDDGKKAVLLSEELLKELTGTDHPAMIPENVMATLKKYRKKLEQIFGDKLLRVIVYGDFLKGKQGVKCDVDLMILMDVGGEELSRHSAVVGDYTYDFNRVYQINIIPTVQSKDNFEREKQQYALYQTIDQKGISID